MIRGEHAHEVLHAGIEFVAGHIDDAGREVGGVHVGSFVSAATRGSATICAAIFQPLRPLRECAGVPRIFERGFGIRPGDGGLAQPLATSAASLSRQFRMGLRSISRPSRREAPLHREFAHFLAELLPRARASRGRPRPWPAPPGAGLRSRRCPWLPRQFSLERLPAMSTIWGGAVTGFRGRMSLERASASPRACFALVGRLTALRQSSSAASRWPSSGPARRISLRPMRPGKNTTPWMTSVIAKFIAYSYTRRPRARPQRCLLEGPSAPRKGLAYSRRNPTAHADDGHGIQQNRRR